MLDCLMQPKRAGLVAVFDIMLCIPLLRTLEQEVSLPVTFYLRKVTPGVERTSSPLARKPRPADEVLFRESMTERGHLEVKSQ